jgi:ABC-2 type transport system permease protein
MRNIFLVIKHEMACTIGKPIFWLTTFVLPLVILALSLGAQYIGVMAFKEEPDILDSSGNARQPLAIGYIDKPDIIHEIPEDIPTEYFHKYSDIETAQKALDAGELSHYYVIENGYIDSGEILVVGQEFSPLGDIPNMNLIQYIVTYNLTGNQELAKLINEPIKEMDTFSLEIEGTETVEEKDEATKYIVGFGVLFILFMVLTMSSSFMLRSVSKEKENRTVEVLLLSLPARDLILGKIIGLGIVALIQMAIWFGGSGFIIRENNPFLRNLGIFLTQGLSLPKGFILWAVLYFLLGYILYASILGAIGALAPNSRETGQFTFIALLPLMIPMWMNTVFVQSPNSLVATAFSLFPLTAPTSMLPRIAQGGVPVWQPIVSVIGLAGATYLFVILAARFFRSDTLLSTASLSLHRLREELKRRQ